MSTRSGFSLHPGAAQDITAIWEYIAGDRPDAAGRFREEILNVIRTLVTFPHRGHRRPDLTDLPFRFVAVKEYLVAYAPDEDPILVMAVVHGRRSPRLISAILRDRQASD